MTEAGLETFLGREKSRFVKGNVTPKDEAILRELAKAIGEPKLPEISGRNIALLAGSGLLAIVQGCATMYTFPANVSCPPIGSDYGAQSNAIGQQRSVLHNGIDIMERFGYPVIAAADGVVAIAGNHPGSGNRVIIYHGEDIDGRHIFSGYLHMNDIAVKTGQNVRRGDKVGTVGNTGSNSKYTHLHLSAIVSPSGSYFIKDDILHYEGGFKLVNPHDFWFKDTSIVGPPDKIIIPHFIEGKAYPSKPIRFTYTVPCRTK